MQSLGKEIRTCPNCGKKNLIIGTHFPAKDGYDHDCSCYNCDHKFFTIHKDSYEDYVAQEYKENNPMK